MRVEYQQSTDEVTVRSVQVQLLLEIQPIQNTMPAAIKVHFVLHFRTGRGCCSIQVSQRLAIVYVPLNPQSPGLPSKTFVPLL